MGRGRFLWSEALANGLQLQNRLPVARASQRVLGLNQRIQTQDATKAGREIDLKAVLLHLLKVPHSLNRPRAVQSPQVGIQIEILEIPAGFRRKP